MDQSIFSETSTIELFKSDALIVMIVVVAVVGYVAAASGSINNSKMKSKRVPFRKVVQDYTLTQSIKVQKIMHTGQNYIVIHITIPA